jgi:hypothetical protein
MRTCITAAIIFAGIMTRSSPGFAQPPAQPLLNEVRHVRSSDKKLASLILRAAKRSPTFRRLIAAIDTTDGIVYVEPGACRYRVPACLVNVSSPGNRRFVFIKVHVRRTDRELMTAIGHELQHAIEVLSHPGVKDIPSLYVLYRNHETVGTSMAFETEAAAQIGEAIADELRRCF